MIAVDFSHRGKDGVWFLREISFNMASMTPQKCREVISPSASKKFCTVCSENLEIKYKSPKDNTYNLWKNGIKTDYCTSVEQYLHTSFSMDTDFRIVCKACYRAITNANESQAKRRLQLETTRKEVLPQHLRKQVKRGIPSDTEEIETARPTKKKANLATGSTPGMGNVDANKQVPDLPFKTYPTVLEQQSGTGKGKIVVSLH